MREWRQLCCARRQRERAAQARRSKKNRVLSPILLFSTCGISSPAKLFCPNSSCSLHTGRVCTSTVCEPAEQREGSTGRPPPVFEAVLRAGWRRLTIDCIYRWLFVHTHLECCNASAGHLQRAPLTGLLHIECMHHKISLLESVYTSRDWAPSSPTDPRKFLRTKTNKFE